MVDEGLFGRVGFIKCFGLWRGEQVFGDELCVQSVISGVFFIRYFFGYYLIENFLGGRVYTGAYKGYNPGHRLRTLVQQRLKGIEIIIKIVIIKNKSKNLTIIQ